MAFAQVAVLPETVRPTTPKRHVIDASKLPKVAPQLLSTPEQKQSDIPETGERISVNAFVLEGLIDEPDYGLTKVKLEASLAQYLSNYPEGLTLTDLQGAADLITNAYRSQGFILATAYIPEQTIEEGIVAIEVVEGRLGTVKPQNHEYYTKEQLTEPFRHLIGKPIHIDSLESALLQLNSYPGLEVFSVLQKGHAFGATDVIIKVQKEQLFSPFLAFNNHGSEFTGEFQWIPGLTINNGFYGADTLSFTGVITRNPDERVYGSVYYDRRFSLPWHRLGDLKWGASYSVNSYDVGGELSNDQIEGTTRIINGFVESQWIRQRDLNLSTRLGFSRKSAVVEVADNTANRDRISVAEFDISIDGRDDFFGINQAVVGYRHGFRDLFESLTARDTDSSRREGDGDFVGSGFDRVTLSMSRLQLLSPLHELFKHHALLFRFDSQYSDDPLVSFEQFVMGGPDSVRAYPSSEFVRDKGLFASVDWLMNAPGFADVPAFAGYTWGDVLQFSAFFDYAVGWNNKARDERDNRIELAGVGVGANVTISPYFQSRVSVAWRTNSTEPSNNHEPQALFEFVGRY